jgi:hypothetical protein
MNLYQNIKYFILGGSVTLLVHFLVDKYKHGPSLTAYLYCAPDIYLVIMYIIYKSRGVKGYYTFIVHSLINYAANLVVILLLVLLINYTGLSIYQNFLLVSVLFIIYSVYYFLYVFKLDFTPQQVT